MFAIPRRHPSRQVQVASLLVGGGAPIVVQSMNSRPALDIEGNLQELEELKKAGCELSRLAIPTKESLKAFEEIVSRSPLPIVADIHFDYRLALAALERGAAALRLNPGNIRNQEGLAEVAKMAKRKQVPIRVGVNAGSLDKRIIAEEGGVNAKSMLRSAREALGFFEALDFDDLCISMKASHGPLLIAANALIAEACHYPIHLGLTEAGTKEKGAVRSAAALAPLLYAGIGDTIRISLTADPVEEVHVAYDILQALGLRDHGARLVSCPGCGRTEVDIRPMAARVEDYIRTIREPLTIAVMGCPVNGPGEAREADYGLAGGRNEYLLFAKGKILHKVKEEEAFGALVQLIEEGLEDESEE